jgi:23S rRNA (guanosine2251-2'-O)-methyltransferase
MSAKPILVWGLHTVEAALRLAPGDALELWLRDDLQDEEADGLVALARGAGIKPQRVNRATLDRLSGNAVHQGVLLRRRLPAGQELPDLIATLDPAANPLVLVLDQIQDPHNLGACLRVADGAGARAVIVTRDRSASLSPTVAKVASGAVDSVPLVAVTNLARALEELKDAGLWVVGATHDAPDTIYSADLARPLALVLGAEGRGLRRLTREHCDGLVSIPMQGRVASLNLSTAAAVCLFEARRQLAARGA